jgi:hypothetical protein
MRVVHVHVNRVDFPKALGDMREWLDRNDRPLVRFETKGESASINIKVHFDSDDLAEQFRQSFRGSYGD